jgi:hypothetical protein
MADFRLWVKFALFLSSYIPLWLAMALKTGGITIAFRGNTVPALSIIFLLIVLLSSLVLRETFSLRKQKEPKFQDIESYKSRHDLLTSYLIAYIFPFVGLDYSQLVNWLIFGIFFVTLGAIQIRSTQLHVNPVLAVLGYRIYEIEDGGKGTNMLVAKRDINLDDDPVKTVELSNRVYLTV